MAVRRAYPFHPLRSRDRGASRRDRDARPPRSGARRYRQRLLRREHQRRCRERLFQRDIHGQLQHGARLVGDALAHQRQRQRRHRLRGAELEHERQRQRRQRHHRAVHEHAPATTTSPAAPSHSRTSVAGSRATSRPARPALWQTPAAATTSPSGTRRCLANTVGNDDLAIGHQTRSGAKSSG